ncbi:hypothetical protein LTR86_003924 [Recurvomyces mirabilis]|nr:hypothetical protein LTR86_003924 [Recurvomyces mirabilis]
MTSPPGQYYVKRRILSVQEAIREAPQTYWISIHTMGISRLHWMAPTGMVLGLAVGILLAAGHHLFYASLSGTEAPTGTLFSVIGADVSRQQLNTAVGTAFAFLVKSALMITVSIAFAQAFWRAIRTSKRGPTLGSLDKT